MVPWVFKLIINHPECHKDVLCVWVKSHTKWHNAKRMLERALTYCLSLLFWYSRLQAERKLRLSLPWIPWNNSTISLLHWYIDLHFSDRKNLLVRYFKERKYKPAGVKGKSYRLWVMRPWVWICDDGSTLDFKSHGQSQESQRDYQWLHKMVTCHRKKFLKKKIK